MKKEYQKNRRTALILWGSCFILTMIFRMQGIAFLTYFFGIISCVFLVISSIFQYRIREIDRLDNQ